MNMLLQYISFCYFVLMVLNHKYFVYLYICYLMSRTYYYGIYHFYISTNRVWICASKCLIKSRLVFQNQVFLSYFNNTLFTLLIIIQLYVYNVHIIEKSPWYLLFQKLHTEIVKKIIQSLYLPKYSQNGLDIDLIWFQSSSTNLVL